MSDGGGQPSPARRSAHEFSILGPLEVSREGAAIPILGARRRALLALLLVQAQRPVSADRLIHDLWDGEPPATARAALQMHVTGLRRALGANPPLRTDSGTAGYVLDVVDGQLDASRFEGLLEQARGQLRAGDAVGASASLHAGLALWRGPALAEFRDLSFARLSGERLDELRIVALEERLELDLDQGRHSEIAGELAVLVHEHPYRERLHGQLMLSLYRGGRQAEALGAYRSARERLVSDLGIEPGLELRHLEQAILRQDPELAAHTASAVASRKPSIAIPLPGSLARPTGEIVGREPELARLKAVWEEAVDEGLRVVAVAGDAGIGKTRLLIEFGRMAHASGATVLYGRCEEEALVPHQPWVEALQHYVRHAPLTVLEEHVAVVGPDLVRLLPGLRHRLSAVPSPPLDEPDTERFRMFEAVGSLVQDVAGDAPVLLVLDDLHWADKPTALLLRHLMHAAPAARMLLLMAYRDAELGPEHPAAQALADARRDCALDVMSLTGLDDHAVAALVRRRRGRDDQAFARALREETAGNAFFIEEVLRDTADDVVAGASVPDGVRRLVTARLARLSEPARRTLVLASVLGQRFDFAVLDQVSDLSRDVLLDALEEALDARLIVEVPDAVERWSFFHALTRAALYDEMSRTRRGRLHLRVGEALVRVQGPDGSARVAETAYHFWRAATVGGAERAVRYAVMASREATGHLAFEEAVRHLRRGLEALAHCGRADPRRETELRIRLGQALQRTGEVESARETFAHAAARAERDGDENSLAQAALGFAGPTFQSFGEVDRAAIELLEQALARLPERDGTLRAQLLARLAMALYFADDAQRLAALADEAVGMARRLGDPGVIAETLESQLWSRWVPDADRLRQGVTVASELTAIGDDLGRTDLVALARRWRIGALLRLGRVDEARVDMREHAILAERLNQTYERMYVTVFQVTEALYQARWADAERGMKVIAAIEQRRAGADAAQFAGVFFITLAFERGSLAGLEPAVEAFARRYPAVPAWRCTIPLIRVDDGRRQEAEEMLAELATDEFGLVPRDANWLISIVMLALACVRLARVDHAATLYKMLLPYREQLVVIGAGGALWGPVSYYLGLLAAVLGRPSEAREHLEGALALSKRTGGVAWIDRAARALDDQVGTRATARPARRAP